MALALVALGLPAASAAPGDPADLSLTIADSPDPVVSGGTLTYTIHVANAGPGDATNVALTDDFPTGTSFGSASAGSGTCQRQGGRVNCDLGTLAAGDGVTATIQVKVTKKKGTVTNAASVTSDVADTQPGNNSGSETTTILESGVGGHPTCQHRAATVVGTKAGETLTGTDGPDVVVAGTGNDSIATLGGADLICAGNGNDAVNSGLGPDTVLAGGGDDFARGSGGADSLQGQGGNDRLRGNRGRDLLLGGAGFDRCHGGHARDVERGCER